MVWDSDELGLSGKEFKLNWKPPLANALALEGLEDYEPAENGDTRFISSIGVAFAFFKPKGAWVQLTAFH